MENGGDFSFNRTISRTSSIGYSSRIYYCGSSEGVPFNWEMRPGTPKEPRNEDVGIPPISPPPAILSQGLPKPCIDIEEPKSSMKLMMLKFWKQGKKNHGSKRVPLMSKDDNLDVTEHADKYHENYETFSFYDEESSKVSSSSSSSKFSFINGHSFRSSNPTRDSSRTVPRHFSRSLFKFSSILGRVSRSRRL